MNGRVVDKVIGRFKFLSIPTHHRDSDVTITSNIAAADTTASSTGDIHAHLTMVGNGAAVKQNICRVVDDDATATTIADF